MKFAVSKGKRLATTEKLSVTRGHVGLVTPGPFKAKSGNKPCQSAGRRDLVKVDIEFRV